VIGVQEFRDEVRQWLADNLVGEYAALKGLGGPGREHEAFQERLAWNRHLAKAGLTCLGWPEEHGGRGLSVAHRVAFYEEYAHADAPDKVNHFGEELLGPTLIAWGTPEQQERFLPRILDVTELWCQGYSEPGAGSDLANVSTAAELRGDPGASEATEGQQWVINGQKVWTSLAHLAQWCFVVARTEKGSKRHAGLSYLLVPLDQPGVEVRPIVQLTGDSEFNEVFFDDARTDADLVVGQPGDGWRVAMGTLTFERGVSTLGQQIRYAREHSGLVELAKRNGAIDDPLIRERLTRSWAGLQTMRSYALATMDVEQRRSRPGGDMGPGQDSVSKLLWANWHRDLGEIAMDVEGAAGLTLDGGEFDEWQRLYLFSRSDTIYGGSNEIQRNIIAERVLGLPREVKGQ
jgi:alkylation response protein AidB-like acyl-CoA dehydrogenase